MLKIKIIGGGSYIGANSYLLETEGRKILLDCGINQKQTDYDSLPRTGLIGDNLDAILISHAHLDHIGALPVLMNRYPGAKVWMSEPTKALVNLVAKDTAKLLRYRGEKVGRLPYYNLYNNFVSQLDKIKTAEFGKTFSANGTEITFSTAGHIIGSSMIHLRFQDSGIGILYTGDFSYSGGRIEEKPDFSCFKNIDVVISESTYAGGTNKRHSISFEDFITGILKKRGRVLIPAFGIGRTQEVLAKIHDMKQKNIIPAETPVFISGMGAKVNRVYDDCYDKIGFTSIAKYVRNIRELNGQTNYICVATSGMLMPKTPSYILAQEILPDKKSGILFPTSFASEEAIGYAKLKNRKVISFGRQKVRINCALEQVNFSAHVKKDELIKLISKEMKPKCLLLVHPGDAASLPKFAKAIKRKHENCVICFPESSSEEFIISGKHGEVTMKNSAKIKAAIITVGTSILTNASKKGINADNKSGISGALKKEPGVLSAELKTYFGIDKEKRSCEKIFLLCSDDGGNGALCGKLLTKYFTERNIETELVKIKGLGKTAAEFTNSGLPNFVNEMINIIERYGQDSYVIATGSFKAIAAYATLISAIFKKDIYYIHEVWQKVVSLPALPIYFDAIYSIDPPNWKKFNNMMYAKTPDDADRIYSGLKPELRELFFKKNGKYSYTAVGLLTSRAYIHSENRRRGKFESIETRKAVKGILSPEICDIMAQRRKTNVALHDIIDDKTRSLIKKILDIFAVEKISIIGESQDEPLYTISERGKPRGCRLFYTIKTGRDSGLDLDIDVLSGAENTVKKFLKQLK